MPSMIHSRNFGKDNLGYELNAYLLSNSNGMKCEVTNYGARIISLEVPDKQGLLEQVVIGFPDIEPYLERDAYYGAVVGRYANRIAGGKFNLDGKTYKLEQNEGLNTLHGGNKGFQVKTWQTRLDERRNEVQFTCLSPDSENGFPGNLEMKVTYRLTSDNTLEVLYEAQADKDTFVNFTQHSYFGLAGFREDSILDHKLQIFADHYLPVDNQLIPSGEYREVDGTVFDFRTPKTIGKDIDANDHQLNLGSGYDHCYVLRGKDGLHHAASVWHPGNGRKLDVFTTEPGLQFYTANHIKDEELSLKPRCAFCLETQHFPDAPNQPDFPSTLLKHGEKFQSQTHFRFSTI